MYDVIICRMFTERCFAYIDESGNVAENNQNRFLVLAALLTNDPLPIQRNVNIAERKIRRQTKQTKEIKAFRQSYSTRKIFLGQLEKSQFSVFSITFDLSTIYNMPYKFDEVYNFGISLLCQRVFVHNQNISLIIDKRYSNEKLRGSLNTDIFEMLSNLNLDTGSVSVRHEDSVDNQLLRAVDFVAYEVYQKNKKSDNLYERIVSHMKEEIVFHDISWGKIKKESKTPQIDRPELRFQSLP